MTRLFLSVLSSMALCMLMSGCKKSLSSHSLTQAPAIQVAAARTWFQHNIQNIPPDPANSNNPRTHGSKWPLWDQARILQISDRSVVLVPLHYKAPLYLMNHASGSPLYAIDEVAPLIIYLDSTDAYHAEVITAQPDSSFSANKTSSLSGLVLIEQWNGTVLFRLHSDGRNILINDPSQEPSTFAAGLITETCYEVDGYNYAADDPDNGESWTEDAGCTPNYFFGSPSSSIGLTAKSYLDIAGGAGSAPPSPAGMFTIVSGNSPIASISDYNKCFTNQPGTDHLYQVALCVEQPVPGTRQPWGFQVPNSANTNNPVDVGHAFLIFSETYGGTTIIRNIGFYPAGYVDPWHSSSQGQLNNNASTDYDIAITYTVDNSQFFNILNFVSQGNNSGYMYDLNGNNCTTFCLRALAAGDIIINSTIGFWPGGSGNDPGDLGEDLRNMPLPANAVLNSTDSPHPNKGTCI